MPIQETWHNVGSKIRYFRKESGLTQRQLARGCDISVNTISLIERSEVAPNIETLCKIANALGVPPSSLFLELCHSEVILQRASEMNCDSEVTDETYVLLSSAQKKLNSPQTIPSKVSPANRHTVLCLCGQIELELDGQRYCLNPGDSLAFNSESYHRWQNTYSATGIAVLVLPSNPYKE